MKGHLLLSRLKVALMFLDAVNSAEGFSWFVMFLVALAGVGIYTFIIEPGNVGLNTLDAAWQRLFRTLTGRSFRLNTNLNKLLLGVEQRQFLFDQLHFYKHLTPQQRRAFDHRTVRFMQSRTFEAREGVDLTDDMKLLISATAVQITFGMRGYMMREFSRIIVYPRRYFNRLTEQHHKGEVNVNGVVVLSWEDFYEGIRIPDDDLNLGLHEFAHVLALQRLQNPAFRDRFFEDSFDKLMHNVNHPGFRSVIQKRLGLRPYAMANPMEFFAVATEAFFENPLAMYHNHRTIYKLFTQMYNLELAHWYNRPVQPLAK